MEYTKLKVSSKDEAKRFYRILAIEGDPDLYTLGAIIGLSVRAWFEHMYYFRKGNVSYVPDIWLEYDNWGEQYPMSQYHLSDLGEKFIYEYDTGEGYVFECKVFKKKYKTDDEFYDDSIGFVIEGKGQGIFENDHYSLDQYFAGTVDPESNEEREELHLPMNMSFETYGDFDKPLDLDEFVYCKEEIEEITHQFHGDSDFIIPTDDEEDSNEALIGLLLNQIAGDIFNDEFMNSIFRKLIKKYDINEAYDMIVNVALTLLSSPEMDEELFESEFKKELKKLK